ncbi:response regulator transcription factor [Noviluteimonas gilva]|uniref:Response regulator n=1 Tax=Noviluteimonas gilva TaxID=2682097 RepID=A0A7C9LG02_9GAMM|nr:response regulator transcription factor [Lysobacter gilvus]MUV12860.1 response regulator [Lysobacter gilvus]
MASPPNALRLLLLEDDAALREEILLPGLADYGFAVTGVATAAALYENLRVREPDIVVLDVGLPDADGFSVAQAVRALLPRIGIIMLTGHGTTSEQVRGLSQGADAYLVKPAQLDLLAATVHSLARRLRGATPAPAANNDQKWHFDASDWCLIAPNGATIPLTKTEQRVLARMSSTLGQLVTREHLVAAVADDVHDFDPHRIESLIHRLRRKVLARCGEPLPLKAIHGKGYVLEDTRHTAD